MRKIFKLVVDNKIIYVGTIKECCEKSYEYDKDYQIEIADIIDEYIYYCYQHKLDLRKAESLRSFREYVAQREEI